MGSYWPPYAVATGDYYRPSNHCTDVVPIAQAVQSSSSAAGFTDYQHPEIPMLLPGQWDAAALTQLQRNNSSLLIDLGNINQLLVQGHRKSFTEQVVLVAKKGVLAGAWTMTNLVMTYRSSSWRDEALRTLWTTSLYLGQQKVTLCVSPLGISTRLDTGVASLVRPKEGLSRNLGMTRDRTPLPAPKATLSSRYHITLTKREHQGPYMWWSTFICKPHNVDHVTQAVFRYFGRAQRPQFIVGEFNMPKSVALIHFAAEPTVTRNFLTLENPARNTGFKVHHDLDIAECRLQIERGVVPDRHHGHRCAVKGLGNPGQGVHFNSSWQKSTSNSEYGRLSMPRGAHDARSVQLSESLEQTITSNEGNSVVKSGGRDDNASPQSLSSGEIWDRSTTRDTSVFTAFSKAPKTNHTESRGRATHGYRAPHDKLKYSEEHGVASTLTVPEPFEIPNKITVRLPPGSSTPLKSPVADVEQMIIEEKTKILSEETSQSLNRDQQSSLPALGGTPQKAISKKTYLTFADIEMSVPLLAITFPIFRDMLIRTEPWETILIALSIVSPAGVQQMIEAYCCFIAHYHVGYSWQAKIEALNRTTTLDDDPRAQRVFRHFTTWLNQQKSNSIQYPQSFPYYGVQSRDAYLAEIRKHPSPSFIRMKSNLQKSAARFSAFLATSTNTDVSKSNGLRRSSRIAAGYVDQNKSPSNMEVRAMLPALRGRSASASSQSSMASSVMSLEPQRMVLTPSNPLPANNGEVPGIHPGPFAEALKVVQSTTNEVNHSNGSIDTTDPNIRYLSSVTLSSYATAASNPSCSPEERTESSMKDDRGNCKTHGGGHLDSSPGKVRDAHLHQKWELSSIPLTNTELEKALRSPGSAFVETEKLNEYKSIQSPPARSDMSASTVEVQNPRKRKADDESSPLEDIVIKSRRLQGPADVATSHHRSSSLDQISVEKDEMADGHRPVASSIPDSSVPQILSVQKDSIAVLPQDGTYAKSISQVESSDLLDILEGALQRE